MSRSKPAIAKLAISEVPGTRPNQHDNACLILSSDCLSFGVVVIAVIEQPSLPRLR